MRKFLLDIPEKIKDNVQLFVNDEYVTHLDFHQFIQYRINIVKYIIQTGDVDVLKDFYFIGHKDDNDSPGKEIKIKMDKNGTLSEYPYEIEHYTHCLCELIKIT